MPVAVLMRQTTMLLPLLAGDTTVSVEAISWRRDSQAVALALAESGFRNLPPLVCRNGSARRVVRMLAGGLPRLDDRAGYSLVRLQRVAVRQTNAPKVLRVAGVGQLTLRAASCTKFRS
jgi:hypothetical protein